MNKYIFKTVAWTVVYFCSSVPVVLFDTPGISRCGSQHVVSVESSSFFHHSIYPWFINCFRRWSIDELKNLHADRTTNYMFWAIAEAEGEVGYPLNRFKPPYPQFFKTDPSKAVLLLWFLTVTCSCCPILWFTYIVSNIFWERAVLSVYRACLSWTAVNLCI